MQFGTSGLRGRAVDMTDDVVAAYVSAFLSHVEGRRGECRAAMVGRDLRPTSPRIAAACRAAIRAVGVDAIDCGALPTPALALEAAARGAPAIMVTGSHIPFDRNGLKFYTPDGEITKADETGILAERDVPRRRTDRTGAEPRDPSALTRYRERCLTLLPEGALVGVRIGVYQHSAVGRDLMVETLRGFGAETLALGRTDDFAPIDTEAVRPEDAAQARDWAAEHRLDALVSTDGDGDRPLIADERGVFLRGDLVGALTARAIGADAVATPITSSTALERSGWFEKVARTRVGSPFVIEALGRLVAEGARLPVGFEANGGFLLGAAWAPTGRAVIPALPTRDAMMPMVVLLGEAARRALPLSALAAEAPARFTASDRMPDIACERVHPFLHGLAESPALRARLAVALGCEAVEAFDTLDGMRLTLANGEIAHLRVSGNAPELRAYAEAEGPARAHAMVAALLAVAADAIADGPGS